MHAKEKLRQLLREVSGNHPPDDPDDHNYYRTTRRTDTASYFNACSVECDSR